MNLASMTWPEVNDVARLDPVCLLPTGAIEQHGPHLPLSVDRDLSMAVCEAVAESARGGMIILVTPPMWLGLSAHHRAYAGTLSASLPTFIGAITEVVDCLATHGIMRFLIVNGHGGNDEAVRLAVRSIVASNPNVTVGAASYWQLGKLTAGLFDEAETVGVGHGGEFETSLMMHCHPHAVRKEMIREQENVWLSDTARTLLSDRSVFVRGKEVGVDKRSKEGVNGDPRRASAEKGARILEACVAGVTEVVERLWLAGRTVSEAR